eukprot:5234898-Amphidinium_carterae.2
MEDHKYLWPLLCPRLACYRSACSRLDNFAQYALSDLLSSFAALALSSCDSLSCDFRSTCQHGTKLESFFSLRLT